MLVPAIGTILRNSAIVSCVNRGTSNPAFTHKSVSSTLKPPELVMIAVPLPEGSITQDNAKAVSSSSSKFSTWTTPACLKSELQISGEPATEPGGEDAAPPPCWAL